MDLQYQGMPGTAVVDGTWVRVASSSNGLSLWLASTPGRPGQPPQYLPGDLVHGKLRACVSSRTTVRAVRAKFTAGARVYWTTGSGKNRRHHSASVLFCPQLNMTLQGPSGIMGSNNFAMVPGMTYDYDVCFRLPEGPLPGTFYASEGTRVAYDLTCYLDIPNWPDAELVYSLDMGGAPGLITPDMALPVDLQTPPLSVYSCCCFFPKGEAVLTLGLPRGAAVPFLDGARLDDGRLLPVVAGVDNTRSTRALGAVVLRLIIEVTMTTATTPGGYGATHVSHLTVAEAQVAAGVAPGELLPPRAMALPGLMMHRAPQFNACRQGVVQCPTFDAAHILRVAYRLALVAHNGLALSLEATLPITFVPTYPERAPAPLPAAVPSAPMPYEAAAAVIATPYGLTEPPMAQATPVYDNYAPTGLGGVPLDAYQGQQGKVLVEPSCPPAV